MAGTTVEEPRTRTTPREAELTAEDLDRLEAQARRAATRGSELRLEPEVALALIRAARDADRLGQELEAQEWMTLMRAQELAMEWYRSLFMEKL